MNIAIVGSRKFHLSQYDEVLKFFGKFFPETFSKEDTIISGGAEGADQFAKFLAKRYSLDCKEFLPDWKTFAKAAGPIRNQTIVDNSDMVIAIWDGVSRGTQDTINKARLAKKNTIIYYFEPISEEEN